MSELASLIKKLKVEAVSSEAYVYYEKDSGAVKKISNRKFDTEDFELLVVTQDEAKPLLKGQYRLDEWVVTYDVSIKDRMLKRKTYEDENKIAATLCYELPLIKNYNDGHSTLESAYDGVDVYIWAVNGTYVKDQIVFYEDNVYKLLADNDKGQVFGNAELFIKDVLLTDMATVTHVSNRLIMQPEYKGVHIDVWYDELPHLAGQHIWINKTVYKILEDQKENTTFSIDNAEFIVSNVELYADKNSSLKTIQNIRDGMTILNNNKIFNIEYSSENFKKQQNTVFWKESDRHLVVWDSEELLKFDSLNEKPLFYETEHRVVSKDTLKNGQLVLVGTQIYNYNTTKDYDIIIQQNFVDKCWRIVLNPYTKAFLNTSGYSVKDKLYFSVTEKYDPNILYRTLELNAEELLWEKPTTIPFIYDVEQDGVNVSIYTAKYFEHYAHEVVQ
tara:strand:+ start:428 stop:1759 length:1332 start_codon:yes stop_codon:yes gene_type:complete